MVVVLALATEVAAADEAVSLMAVQRVDMRLLVGGKREQWETLGHTEVPCMGMNEWEPSGLIEIRPRGARWRTVQGIYSKPTGTGGYFRVGIGGPTAVESGVAFRTYRLSPASVTMHTPRLRATASAAA